MYSVKQCHVRILWLSNRDPIRNWTAYASYHALFTFTETVAETLHAMETIVWRCLNWKIYIRYLLEQKRRQFYFYREILYICDIKECLVNYMTCLFFFLDTFFIYWPSLFFLLMWKLYLSKHGCWCRKRYANSYTRKLSQGYRMYSVKCPE